MLMLAVVMVFGMFNLRARAVRMVCAYTLVLMGAVMVWSTHNDPLHFPARLEVFYFIFLAVALPVISTLSSQLIGMRTRLKTHQRELEKALAQRLRQPCRRYPARHRHHRPLGWRGIFGAAVRDAAGPPDGRHQPPGRQPGRNRSVRRRPAIADGVLVRLCPLRTG
jgi:hypothetical protein